MTMEKKPKPVIVVGLGRSGIAAIRLLRSLGHSVIGTDRAPLEKLSPELRTIPIPIHAGGHEGVPFEDAQLIVVSPGVPTFPALERAEAKGVEVIGELELGARQVTTPIVAVGGTNGKSTVTTLTALMLKEGGLRIFAGGNLGTPLCEAVGEDYDALVVEVSSFQLERVRTFKPKVSILLNVTEDHLDRYPSFLAYAEAKGNAFVLQDGDDLAVVPDGDEICAEQAARGHGWVQTFGERGDYQVKGRTIVETATGTEFTLEGSRLFGAHNVTNVAACIAAARKLGVTPDAIARAILTFEPLPHRMAFVRELAGVRFYDDSKGTNVGASVTALLGLEESKGVLIAGGRDKLGSYEPLVEALRNKGRALVVLGEAAEAIARASTGVLPIERAATLQEAVEIAFRLARPGDAVLLSPACASFDMFKSYAERGSRFVEAVQALREPPTVGPAPRELP
jgi:UDP-N-acetylmuramoylalanine--D-glutamate ligase